MTHNCYGNNKYLTAKPKSSQKKPKDSWQNQKAHRIIISCSERLWQFVLAFRFCCEIFVIAMTVVGHHEIQISYCKALDTYTVINSKLQHPPSPPIGVWTSSVPGGWRIWTLSGWGGEFEQVVSSLSSWKQVLYLQIWRCLLVSIIYQTFTQQNKQCDCLILGHMPLIKFKCTWPGYNWAVVAHTHVNKEVVPSLSVCFCHMIVLGKI